MKTQILNTQIIAKNFKLTDSIKDAIDENIEKVNDYLSYKQKESTSIIVTLSISNKKQHLCHINFNNEINIKKESNDMYNSIDKCFEILTKTIINKKERKLNNRFGLKQKTIESIEKEEENLEELLEE